MMTKEKFEAYVEVQKSGITNMCHIPNVIFAVDGMCNVTLTGEDCLEIMQNYAELKEKWRIKK